MIQILDPSHEAAAAGTQKAPRIASLAGKNVAFISNGKEGTKGFFNHLNSILTDDFGVSSTQLLVKSNYSAPADPHIMARIPEFDAVVTGLGD